MTIPTLILPDGLEPTVGTGIETEARVLEASFGDGYSQISPSGINSVADAVTLIVEQAPVSSAALVTAQLAAWKGATTFLFRLPDEATARKWTCRKWSTTRPEFGLTTLTITLRESFKP